MSIGLYLVAGAFPLGDESRPALSEATLKLGASGDRARPGPRPWGPECLLCPSQILLPAVRSQLPAILLALVSTLDFHLHLNSLKRIVAWISLLGYDLIHYIHPINYFSEYRVFAVKEWGIGDTYEKLRSGAIRI